MDDIRPQHPEDPTPGSTSAAASDRLRLEVELLAPTESSPAPAAAGLDAVPRTVLVAVGEPDLGTYVRRCLRAYRSLRVVEPDAGEHALAAVRRLSPTLLIAEAGTVGATPPLSVPLLLLVEELPESTAARQPPAALAFLLQPFNTRRLLAAVEPLLGPPDAAGAGGTRAGLQPL
jgi:hypothetical protein